MISLMFSMAVRSVYTYIYMCVYLNVHICAHKYTPAYIHIYIYVYTCGYTSCTLDKLSCTRADYGEFRRRLAIQGSGAYTDALNMKREVLAFSHRGLS